jgi:hypothetical protein
MAASAELARLTFRRAKLARRQRLSPSCRVFIARLFLI